MISCGGFQVFLDKNMKSSRFPARLLMSLAVSAVGGLLALAIVLFARRRTLKHAPGPAGLPFIGNLLDVPTSFPWLPYHAWAVQYSELFSRDSHKEIHINWLNLDSPIIRLSAAGAELVILDTYEAATELLDKRSRTYSSRCGISRKPF